VPLVDVDEDEIINFGIYQSLEEALMNNGGIVDLRNPELSGTPFFSNYHPFI